MDFQTSSSTPDNNKGKVISYLSLRLIIGVIGISLPFLLIVGTYFLDKCSPAFQYSISHYYYTQMHMLFVGLLCVLGAFLITYKGKVKYENSVSLFAGLCSLFVAIFPDDRRKYIFNQLNCSFIMTENLEDYVTKIHFVSATLLFLSFAIICFFFFTKSDEPINDPIKKYRRNIAYRICGIGIIISLIFCFLFMNGYLHLTEKFTNHSVLIFETTALFFFGFSWLLKGSLMWPRKKYILPVLIRFFR